MSAKFLKMTRFLAFSANLTLCLPALALGADKVIMATSEDLSSFDAQLGAAQPSLPAQAQGGGKSAAAGSAVGAAISAEAKKLKDSASREGFGRRSARPLAPGQSIGADGGSAPGAAIGMDSSTHGSKADPGAHGKGKSNGKGNGKGNGQN